MDEWINGLMVLGKQSKSEDCQTDITTEYFFYFFSNTKIKRMTTIRPSPPLG